MSHPSHELSPPEHRLSQDVLEFLIAHQDWFMLDTPPPPALPPTPSRSLTPPLTSHTVSVSDDEGPDGWRLIDRHPRPSHPTADRDRDRDRDRSGGNQGANASGSAAQSGNKGGERDKERMQAPSSFAAVGAPVSGIMRSRTVPTSRKGRMSTVDAGAMQRGTASGSVPANPAVLRKARRASAQPV